MFALRAKITGGTAELDFKLRPVIIGRGFFIFVLIEFLEDKL